MIFVGIENQLVALDKPGTIAITYPVGGESWFTGTVYNLTADAVDADGASLATQATLAAVLAKRTSDPATAVDAGAELVIYHRALPPA